MSDVNTENKSFKRAKYRRKAARDAIFGADEIKRANEIYLPMPSGFDSESSPDYTSTAKVDSDSDMDLSDMPWYHSNAAYSSYLHRARYPEICIVALNGLVGTATDKPPTVKLPSQIEYLEKAAGKQGESIYEIYAESVIETLIAGNASIQVDVNEKTNNLFLNVICAEDVIDWDEKNADDSLTFLNIQRNISIRDEKDIFKKDVVKKNSVYSLKISEKTSKSIAVLEKFENGTQVGLPIELQKQGINFSKIPVFPIGSQTNKFQPQSAPISGLSEIALSIYRKDADLSNAEYMTCNPNLVITGAENGVDANGNETGVPHIVGSQVALCIANPDAKVYYTTTDTSALEHMRTVIQDLFTEAAMYSVSVIGQEKKSAEAAETVEMRKRAQGATLINIVVNCGKAIKNALEFAASLTSDSATEVIFEVNTDFAQRTISPQLLTALIQAWMARGLSLETLLTTFKEAGILSKETTVEQELARINAEPPSAE